jgi:hypothetical protein
MLVADDPAAVDDEGLGHAGPSLERAGRGDHCRRRFVRNGSP